MADCDERWEAWRREIILFKDPVVPQHNCGTVRNRNKASYDAALEEIYEVMHKFSKPDNDVKETAHQGRQLYELASSYILAVRTARPHVDDGKAHLGRELKQLKERADRGEDPPPVFQGLDPFVDAVPAWRSMLRAMETLRNLGGAGSHRGRALRPSDRSRIYEAACEVAHAVLEMTHIYFREELCHFRPWNFTHDGWLHRVETIERLLLASSGLTSVGTELAEAGKAMSTLKDTPVQPATGEVIKLMATNAKAKALTERLDDDLEVALSRSLPATAHDLAPLVELIRKDDGDAIRPNVLAAEALHDLFWKMRVRNTWHKSRQEQRDEAMDAAMDAAMAQAAIAAGCLPPLIANLRSRCTDVAVAAAQCLSVLTYDASFQTAFKAAGGVRALLDLLAARTGGRVFDKTSGLPVTREDGEQPVQRPVKRLTIEEFESLRARQLVLASDSDPRMPANGRLEPAHPCVWGTDGFGPVALFVARLGRVDVEVYAAMIASGAIESIVTMARGDGPLSPPRYPGELRAAAEALRHLLVHKFSEEPCPPPHLISDEDLEKEIGNLEKLLADNPAMANHIEPLLERQTAERVRREVKDRAAFSPAPTIVASGGREALIALARHGDLSEAHAAAGALRRLVELGHVEAPSPWPMRRGSRELNPWMEPARRLKIYGDS